MGIYPWVTGTCHFINRAYPDPQVFSPAGILSGYLGIRHNTGIYPQVTGTHHFGKKAYPDPRVFSPAGIIGGYMGKMHCLPG